MARLSTIARFEVSGEILSEDTLSLLSAPVCKVPGSEMDDGDFAVAYDLLLDQWQSIRSEVAGYDTERLRKRWLLRVLDVLDFKPEPLRAHTAFGEHYTIPLTHRSGEIPMWLLGYGESFDERPTEGRRRRSPHELFQEYLDLTDDDWGILFNGSSIRLLHDYHKSLTRNYVEADLESIFDALDIDGFRAVWRVFHASRFANDAKGECQIAKLRDFSRQDGAAVGKELRSQVRKAIEVLGNGFLAADQEGVLSQALHGDPAAVMLFYQSLLKVVYRILFLLYIENRPNWTPAQNPVWADSYSITRLREMAEETRFSRSNGEDLWEGMKVVSRIIREGSEFFGIHPYGGELFDDEKLGLLKDASLSNSDLLAAIRLLTMFERDKQVYRVNFRYLDVEALGSVYEGLLDATAVIMPDGSFGFAEGTERKLTGSYYTPKELVAELIKSALVPVIEDRLAGNTTPKDQEDALKSIKVVDPACGSGAFLVQALEKLAEKLVEIRLGGEEPSDEQIREARRDIVRHCIHGVDLNPLAVDLCRFVLWLNVAHPRFPLSYLEPLIKSGNSLVGVPLPSQVKARRAEVEAERKHLLDLGDHKAAGRVAYVGWNESIPDEAFNPVSGDDAAAAKAAKKQNAQQRSGQLTTDAAGIDTPGNLADYYGRLRATGDATVDEIHSAEVLYHTYLGSLEYTKNQSAADLWCAAFFWRHKAGQQYVPTNQWLKLARQYPDRVPEKIWHKVGRLQGRVRFFHWHLEFPDVFRSGGFDCVLGNPPWERIKLQEQEFFATRAPAIAQAANKAAREILIHGLETSDPVLAEEFADAKHDAESESRFARQGDRFRLTAVGDVNTYALFAELFLQVLSSSGRSGLVCPTGIATDDSTKAFFAHLARGRSIAGLFDFENREALFPGVHRSYKFCLLTMSGSPVSDGQYAFFLTRPEQLNDGLRKFALSPNDIALLNPNTLNCPVFRTQVDAEMTKSLYRRLPILVDRSEGLNPWGVRLATLIHMSNDSDILRTRQQLESEGCRVGGKKIFVDAGAEPTVYLPLHEGRLGHQFDHRYASNVDGEPIAADPIQHADPCFEIEPQYWFPAAECAVRLARHESNPHGGMLGFRRISNNTNERGCLASIIPWGAASYGWILLFGPSADDLAVLAGMLNSFAFDYILRNALSQPSIPQGTAEQVTCVPPAALCPAVRATLITRALELTYTAWDIKAFADDVWQAADAEVREAIQTAWESNKAVTGGHEWNHPDWVEINELGIPVPPFRWDEDRRAVLRAELDAYYARLYGLTRKQLRYILDPHGLSHKELEDILDPWEDPTCSGPHLLPAEPAEDFPGETFRVLKDKEEKQFDGDYRTRRLVLEAWARLEAELGPVQPVNYRELLEQERRETQLAEEQAAKAQKSVAKNSEPEDLVLRAPDHSDQGKLTFDAPEPVKKPGKTATTAKPTPQPSPQPDGKRVRINGQPGTLISEESRDGKTKVFIQLDREEQPRSFYIPPAVMEHM